MPIKVSRMEKISASLVQSVTRKVQELDFYNYLKDKKSKKYMKEISIADHLTKKSARTP